MTTSAVPRLLLVPRGQVLTAVKGGSIFKSLLFRAEAVARTQMGPRANFNVGQQRGVAAGHVSSPCQASDYPLKTSELCARNVMGMAQARAEGRISKAQWRAWQLAWRSPNAGSSGVFAYAIVQLSKS
jgi:hypothetical protein